MAEMTPMLRQYLEIKAQYEDCILFFRLGDFYEMFYEDARTASKVLEITLTGKNVGADRERAPLCGVPFHSAEGYIAKLVENGYKVAICEQTEDPKLTKGLVKREVIRVVTPGKLYRCGQLTAYTNPRRGRPDPVHLEHPADRDQISWMAKLSSGHRDTRG